MADVSGGVGERRRLAMGEVGEIKDRMGKIETERERNGMSRVNYL